jgi:hypothetical protein
MGTVSRKASNRINYIKNTKTVMDEGEGEGRRTIEEIYKDSVANFASICLGMSYLLYIK